MTAQPAPTPNPGAGIASAPSWGSATGFLQKRQPAFWLFVLTLAATGLAALAEQLSFLAASPGAWFVTVLLLVPYAIPVFAIIYYLDLYEREPVSILVAAVLWGGIVATTLSMYTNTPLDELIFKITADPQFTLEWSAALTAPFVEEGFKLLGLILLVSIARDEMDDLLDGFIWGAMVGIGFLLVEDVFYFMRAYFEQGSFVDLFVIWLIRIVGAGPYSHFLYTGLVGMGVAYYYTQLDQPNGRRLAMAAVYIALGVAAHFIWNSPLLVGLAEGGLIGLWLMLTVKGLPMLIGLVILVRLARRRERRWFAHFSATFHDDGAVAEAELAELSGLRARRRARKAALRAKGPMGEQLKGQIQREQMTLVQLMSKHGAEERPEIAVQQAKVLALKAQYEALEGPTPYAATPVWVQPTAPTPAAAVPAQPAAGQGWGQPAVPAQPAPAAAPVAVPAWTGTHLVPADGLQAWPAPDPGLPLAATLSPGLEVEVAERAGDWARVVAVNGWTGWVDGRRLVARS
jgi:RsiW-degrading membrane proteinase PrsW (M82 family)